MNERNTHGGLRSRHCPRALTAFDVADIRNMRAFGIPYKVIARKYPDVTRVTLSRAANGRSTYAS